MVNHQPEQVSEFLVDEEMQKQVKQNYKHEVHLLVLGNHWVASVVDMLGWGMEAVLDMVVERTQWAMGMDSVGMEVVVACHMLVESFVEAGRKVAGPGEGFESSQQVDHHMLEHTFVVAVDRRSSVQRMSLLMAEEHRTVGRVDMWRNSAGM